MVLGWFARMCAASGALVLATLVVVSCSGLATKRGTHAIAIRGPNAYDHWHAALGVYLCDHWQGGGSWPWPAQTPVGAPARAGTQKYAGLHSHGDGIIHIEPQASDEVGAHATLGTYFTFGGWKLSTTVIEFLGRQERNGDRCEYGDPGRLRWEVNGVERAGNPADYVLQDGDVIVIAFVPGSPRLSRVGPPPSLRNLSPPAASPSATTAPRPA